MSGLLRSMGVALLAAGLSGCVTYPPEYYYPGDAQGGSAYYYGERYDDGYGYDGGYVEQPYGGGYSAGWPAYYSTLWPVYRNYYDPFWSPGFYYGVTWFPSTYFGIGIGGWDAWPYYTAYSPYRYAFWDNYYAWYDPWYYGGYYGYWHWDDDDWDDDDDHHRHGGGNHGGNGGWRDPPQGGNGPRFGSARNEAERLASLSGAGAQSQAGKYGTTGDATGRFAGRNWRGTPPQGALSQSGSAGRAPVSNADLYGGGRFASRPGAMPAGAAPSGSGGYRDDARTGYVPGGSAGGARGESQRMGGAPASPAGDRGNAYSAPRGSAPQATSPNAGYVGPAPRSRPTGNQDWRRYEQGAQPDANAAPRSYSRQLPQEGYTPIQGSTGGNSRWRSAPPSAPAPDSRGYVQGNRGYAPRQQPAPQQGNYGVPQGATVPRYSTRPQGYAAPQQQRYQAPPQNYQAPPQGQPRFQAPSRGQSQPRYEAPPPPRESSRDDGPSDGGGGFRDSGGSRDSSGGSSGESSRFARGGRDRED